MFSSVLIANRGEIAVRIIRTLRRLGITPIAVHSPADVGAPHVRAADRAVALPRGYLDIDGVIEACRVSGAEALHPGYGFLAENPELARRCAEAGVRFIGPPAEAIEAMGDKIRAKETVARAGVPVVPGATGDLLGWTQFPALIKPSAGGGGKGMVLVGSAAELPDAIESATRTAQAAFGDGTLLIERYVNAPRHIEIQVMADTHGAVIHLGERECSLQRRHQKIVEEAPSPLLDGATRERMGAAAVEAARSVGYVGAGTVEFIVNGQDLAEFFFMEMNTRLQVEHPVTEMVTGLDLVELQLRVAAGEPLPLAQHDVTMRGHAIEARVYAEDPSRGFLPTGGTVLALGWPPAARVDSGIAPGTVVGSDYDPMLAKVVAHGATREHALSALGRALARTVILGVTTNVAFLQELIAHPEVRAGRLDTGLVERLGLRISQTPPDGVFAGAALAAHGKWDGGGDPWDVRDGWRIGEPAWTPYRIDDTVVRVRGDEVEVDGRVHDAWLGDHVLSIDGQTLPFEVAIDGRAVWVGFEGQTWSLTRHEAGDPQDRDGARAGDGTVRSPMPGTVLAVKAAPGDRVSAGQPLVVVEAMKMEHGVTAPFDGVVAEVPVRPGQQVALDAVLAVVTGEG
ncbi:acetyl/propionyl-CoA carboxylase subunit alpha [Streptosporangiaceae bacterium NEAU-GS5]|nr:acetyl/propionyl-CoA carboxylase subunit alpha [Streptosporangiaceae bacterium NEAU-GS5]